MTGGCCASLESTGGEGGGGVHPVNEDGEGVCASPEMAERPSLPLPSFRPSSVISTGGPALRAGAERRNPAGAPPTPQALASARRPSPAGFLRSLRFGRNDGWGRRGTGAGSAGLFPFRHFDRSAGRRGVEKPGGRSVDAAGSCVRPAPVAGRVSPLAPLGRNDGRGLRSVEMTVGGGAGRGPGFSLSVISTGAPAGAEWRNPEGAPSTPQALASARRPSLAGFLRSLRFGRNDGRGLRSVEMTVGGGAGRGPGRPGFSLSVISTGAPSGAERRNPEGAPSTPQALASARRPSPAGFLHSLRFGRNDGEGVRRSK